MSRLTFDLGPLRHLVLLAAVLVSGCASVTTVVLMPDEGGRVGAITVRTKAGIQVVDRAYHGTTVEADTALPSAMTSVGEAAVERDYAALLLAQPKPPRSFFLYFPTGSAALSTASRMEIPEVLEAIKARAPTEVAIFGHTDSVGTEHLNIHLSAERAMAVENALRRAEPSLPPIRMEFLGDTQPLVPIVPETPQPMNRCVEIQVL